MGVNSLLEMRGDPSGTISRSLYYIRRTIANVFASFRRSNFASILMTQNRRNIDRLSCRCTSSELLFRNSFFFQAHACRIMHGGYSVVSGLVARAVKYPQATPDS